MKLAMESRGEVGLCVRSSGGKTKLGFFFFLSAEKLTRLEQSVDNV